MILNTGFCDFSSGWDTLNPDLQGGQVFPLLFYFIFYNDVHHV